MGKSKMTKKVMQEVIRHQIFEQEKIYCLGHPKKKQQYPWLSYYAHKSDYSRASSEQ
jgi:hypothetical protein